MEKITKQLQTFCDRVKDKFQKNIERERSLDRPLEAISRALWPYPESKLVFYVSLLAVLDYLSTFIALELSGNSQLSEVGPLANWALETGGFPRLLFVDAAVIFALICVAIGVKSIYTRLGLRGFARAAFAFLMVPYFVFITGVVVNNVLVVFL